MNYTVVVTLIFVGFALAEAALGRLLQPQASGRDRIIEAASGVLLPLVVIPTVFTLSPWLLERAMPGHAGALAHWPSWLMFAVLLLADDLTQYLYHRASHRVPWLWNLHRAHHSAPYLSIRCTYRNNILYYAMMPGLWLSAVLVHVGFAPVYAWYAILKMLVVTGAHSSAPWDAWLLRRPALSPLLWIVERVISTPTTHAAHHGRHALDPGTFYRGNYGNFLFVWDMLLGTGRITRRRPQSFGLENVEPMSWVRELLWPFARRRR